MASLGKASAWTALVALALGPGCTGADAGAGSTGDTGVGGSGGAGGSPAGGTTAASTTGSGAGGMVDYHCDPPAEPGSIYETGAETYDINQIDPVGMCKYRGDVMLIVNTAAV